ncbi:MULTISPECIES: hypothetical protein [Bacillus cereus group]|uniref:Uncharacterized protein n=1 Tax=Bacillus mobilis TaxID=2026190 RepID=A0A1Y6AQ57_9BACI|nr:MULTISPECIES: hypothetical protein [Bacillus cereus group]MDG1622308.1 hypothetical protein [Bacillus mobilis]MDX5839919.1 hypothetical protein [Bacillus cereus group sp. BfR-BA-01700]NEL01186.1 hypothetical protein [Bacillus mobilis]OJE34166.1 hypothetical protein BAQ44_20250 [Bacillus mobilis]SME43521.1 hypothetical protein BACERE00185_04868 [Bacillus mobilis]
MINTIYIIIFWILILFPILYVIKIKHWNLKVAAVFVGRILLSIIFFINGITFGMQRNWSEPPYETEWDFFIKSLQHGKTDALIEVFLLIIIITLDLAVIFFYRNKKK